MLTRDYNRRTVCSGACTFIYSCDKNTFIYTIKPVNKGHLSQRYRQYVFIVNVNLFYFIKEGSLKHGLYLQGGLYSEVTFNTCLAVLLFTSDF